MGNKTGIAWTDSTHNFWYGCQKVSQGCKFCYAEREMNRYGKDFRKVTRAIGFDKPLHWRDGRMIFINSWSDFFIEEADEWRPEAWDIIKRTPQHTYQILTKRPERIMQNLPGFELPNVWIGTTAEDQESAFRRVKYLFRTPFPIRFISVEPMLSKVDLGISLGSYVDWVICGCESGPQARPMNINWARDLRDQCHAAGVPFFLKQMMIDGKLVKEPMLDGRQWLEFPEVK